MASPPERRGANVPEACLTRIALALLPASCLIDEISARETELSAVTTTRSVAGLTYHAMPSTPESSTAALAAATCDALESCAGAACDAEGTASATTETMLTAARGWANHRRSVGGLILMGSSCGVGRTCRAGSVADVGRVCPASSYGVLTPVRRAARPA